MAARRTAALGLALALVLGGCSAPAQEPGLFRVRSPSPAALTPAPTPSATDSATRSAVALPVAGEAVRTTGEGAELTVRYAVHAVRRMAGATVLDFSVTPLTAPGLQDGDELPGGTDLGISTEDGGSVRAWLLDPAALRGYPQLTHTSRAAFHHCLCTPLWAAQPELRLGTTRLLQLAFPALPARTRRVDVLVAGLPAVTGVPVTPSGQVPTVGRRVDLTRPADEPAPASPPVVVGSLTDGTPGVFSLTIDQVLSSPGSTSVRWSIRSINNGFNVRRQPLEPPLSAVAAAGVALVNSRAVSGLTLRAASGGPTLPTQWLTERAVDRPAYDCLCTNLGLWARSLDEVAGAAHGTSVHPPLPPGTDRVVLRWPGLAPVTAPVEAVPDAGSQLGPPRQRPVHSWVYSEELPPPGWSAADWPTPLPDPWQLPDYRAAVSDIAELPTS